LRKRKVVRGFLLTVKNPPPAISIGVYLASNIQLAEKEDMGEGRKNTDP